MSQAAATEMATPRWKELYRLAGIAAIISELVILLGIVTYFIWPYAPGSNATESIFLLLQSNLFGGLVPLDLFLVLGNLFSTMTFLALYVSLRSVNESYALAALVVGLVGLVLLFPSRPILELLALSRQYSTATTDTARSQLVAAGDALLSQFDVTGWFLNTLLGALSLLTSSLLMLRNSVYSKATAYAGIITNIVVCGFFIPVLGKFLLFLSLPGYMIWYFLLAKAFFRMSRSVRKSTNCTDVSTTKGLANLSVGNPLVCSFSPLSLAVSGMVRIPLRWPPATRGQ
jgi:hypothetical protein